MHGMDLNSVVVAFLIKCIRGLGRLNEGSLKASLSKDTVIVQET